MDGCVLNQPCHVAGLFQFKVGYDDLTSILKCSSATLVRALCSQSVAFASVHTQTPAVPVVTSGVNGTATVREWTSETFQLSTISSVADSCCPSARLFVSSAVGGGDALTFSLSVHWAGKSPDLSALLLSSQRNCLVFLASEGDCRLFFCCVSFFDNYVE